MTPGRPPSSTLDQRRSHDAARSQARYARAGAVIRSVRLDRIQASALARKLKTSGTSIADLLRDAIAQEAERLRISHSRVDTVQPRRARSAIHQVVGNVTLDDARAADLDFIRERTHESTSSLIRRLIEAW